MRLFTAIALPDTIKDKLYNTTSSIKNNAEKGNFSRKENYHITLVFLGETHPSRIDEAKSIIDSAADIFPPMMLSCGNVGYFQKKNRKILYYNVGGNTKSLTELQNYLYDRLYKIGLCKKQNDYTPHITLARQVLTNKIPVINQEHHFPAGAVTLMHSTRLDGLLTYIPIYSSNFKGILTVDRIVQDMAVCEGANGKTFSIDMKYLPESISSGTKIRYNGCEFVTDEALTLQEEIKIRRKFNKETGNRH